MYYNNYNANDKVLPTIIKTSAGQAIDMVSPQAGLAYHIATTFTARNNIDLALGILGILGSSIKIAGQNQRNV